MTIEGKPYGRVYLEKVSFTVSMGAHLGNHSHGTQRTFALDQEQIRQLQKIKDVLSKKKKNCVCDLLFSIIFLEMMPTKIYILDQHYYKNLS